jgi:hypothetical protein
MTFVREWILCTLDEGPERVLEISGDSEGDDCTLDVKRFGRNQRWGDPWRTYESFDLCDAGAEGLVIALHKVLGEASPWASQVAELRERIAELEAELVELVES